MHLTSSLAAFAALLACNAHLAAANVAYVFTFDPETANSKHKIALSGLSPSTARLVLAQRAGVEDFHTTHGISDEEINAINTYGLRTSMFGSDSPRRRAFILAPLNPADEANTQLRFKSRFSISSPPSFSATKDLFSDLLEQATPDNSRAKNYLYDEKTLKSTSAASPWFHIAEDASSLIELSRKLSEEMVTVTALLISEGESTTSWGSYVSPQQASLLKRQVPHRIEEEPLSAFTSTIPSSSLHVLANSSNSSSNYTNRTPLQGILPACFASKKACESTTRGCTGHGSCTLKYSNKDVPANSKVGKDCWGCVCGTTKTNGLTTYWAGPACQKKDISVEFWLIALFTIGLLSLVSFAIGTIWSMGEEDLPSVIGAGVSGPTARK